MSEPDNFNIIPPAFWGTLSDEEWEQICTTGMIEGPLVERLYCMTDRHGERPASITPLISRADVEKRWPSRRAKRKGRR